MTPLARPRVRLVLFDVFDTLCTPRIPVHEQYAAEARAAGIGVSPQAVRAAFKPAFKEMSATYPLYGKHSTPPLAPAGWWGELIARCLRHAGAPEHVLAQKGEALTDRLLARFESEEGYRNFPDTIPTLEGLRSLGVKLSIVSNADPRILNTLTALGLDAFPTSPPTLSWDVEASKPSATIFEAACAAAGEVPGPGIIMVGDELEADFRGATGAGLEGRLIRRLGEWSDGARRHALEDLGSVNVVSSLAEVLDEVRARNS